MKRNLKKYIGKYLNIGIVACLAIAMIVVVVKTEIAKREFMLIPPPGPKAVELKSDELKNIIDISVQWFKNAQEETGHFSYEYSPFDDSYSDDDNMVRQTGVLYALGEILAKSPGDTYSLKETMRKTIAYFKENTFEEVYEGKAMKCVMKSKNNCSTGATSLALVGILDLVEKFPELATEYEDLIDGYVNFIVFMRNPDAGFGDSYGIKGTKSSAESAFGNGEAFLALVRYYQYKEPEEVGDMIEDVGEYFVDYYTENLNGDFYLWGMAAIKDIYKTDLDKDYFDFVKTYTDWRIGKFRSQRNTRKNKCAYVEGLTSAYSILESDLNKREREYYLEEINFWLEKMKNLQVTSGYTPEVTFKDKKIPSPAKANGGFLTSLDLPAQRIDFTQHCVSSYLQKLVDIDAYID